MVCRSDKIFKRLFYELKGIVDKHKDSNLIDPIVEWADPFLDQATSDYKRFLMIYLTSPPPLPISKEVGSVEKLYKTLKLMDYSLNVVKAAFEREGIKEPKT